MYPEEKEEVERLMRPLVFEHLRTGQEDDNLLIEMYPSTYDAMLDFYRNNPQEVS